MLLSLLDEAVNHDEACQFILDKVSLGSETDTSTDEVLRGIKQDLLELAKRRCLSNDHVSADLEESLRRRQGNICHISGSDTDLKPVYMVSPSIIDDQELKQGVSTSNLRLVQTALFVHQCW